MAASAAASDHRAPAWHRRAMAGNTGPVLVILIAIVVIWYVATFALNAPFQRDLDERRGATRRPSPSSSRRR